MAISRRSIAVPFVVLALAALLAATLPLSAVAAESKEPQLALVLPTVAVVLWVRKWSAAVGVRVRWADE